MRLAPAPAPDLQYLSAPVDLKKVSPSYHKAQLDKLWEEARARHEADRKAVAAAEKAAREGLRTRHVKVTQKGFLAMLVHTEGLQHVFDAVFARQQQKLADRHAAARTAMNAKHARENGAIRDEYATVRQRVQERLESLNKREDRQRQQSQKMLRDLDKTEKEITTPKHVKRHVLADENKRDITEKKSRGTRRGDVRGLRNSLGVGYGYRRSTKKPPKPDDDNEQ